MLVRASRDGNLDIVLRLLYTNPFVERQELHDALWEAVRCRRVDVVRSLLEFRVDPASAPSPELSRPPDALRERGIKWSPLAALAVNGSTERAELVAELLTNSSALGGSFCGTPANPGKRRSAADAIEVPPPGPANPFEERTQATASRAKPTKPSALAAPPAAPHATAQPCQRRDASTQCRGATGGGAESDGCPAEVRALRTLLDHSSLAHKESWLAGLKTEDVASLEAAAEGLLRTVREHRQKRWEAQLQSVTRRHAEESRGRQTLEEEQACIVCSDFAKSVLFLPCRHLCACDSCAPQLASCPICRAQIDRKVNCIRP
mmetsp:Transcript_107562/g.302811  ORF Transcript_107562/g.302811 Transcript_107562/m.302811 type:complete len:320 (-) Transcript_107562:224-1183(-)